MATCIHGWGSDGMTPSGCPQCAVLGREATSTALCEALDRIKVLEGALEDAIGAIRHAAHPVASQWLPSLEKKLRPQIRVSPNRQEKP